MYIYNTFKSFYCFKFIDKERKIIRIINMKKEIVLTNFFKR